MTPREKAAERLGEIVPWFSDPPNDFHKSVANYLTDLWLIDRSLAETVSRLEWVVDGIVWTEERVLQHASNDLEVMKQLLDVPWFVDGITHNEGQLLFRLAYNGFREPYFSWVLKTAEYTSAGDLRSFLLRAFRQFGYNGLAQPKNIDQLMAQSWINDGLDDDEAALLVYLGFAVASGAEFNDALDSYAVQSASITLPLAGDVTIRAFREGPFAPDDNLLEIAVNSTPIIEEVMGIPLPTTDIILIVHPDLDFGGMYSFASLLIRWYGAVPHEIAHYYTDANNAPVWLREGTAEFAEAYVSDWTGVESLRNRRLKVAEEVRHCKEETMIENLSHLSTVDILGFSCYYSMGEDFMHRVVDLIGLEAMQSILKELYPMERVQTKNEQAINIKFMRDVDNSEQFIYRTFLKHTPPELREQFRDLHRQLHGGPFSPPYLDRPDDHGDQASEASRIAAGDAVKGGLDYEFDFDYFSFRADADQKYQISVTHETLRPTSVYLFAPDGQILESIDKQSTPYGPNTHWVALRSGDYYFVVHNYGGHTGTYELTIRTYTPPADDHGDTLTDATGILVNEVVEGALEDSLDFDYFWFDVEANQGYRIFTSEEGGLYRHSLWLYYFDGKWAMEELREVRGEANGQSYLLVPATSGRRYFSIEAHGEAVATYTVIIRQEPIPQDTQIQQPSQPAQI